MSAPPAVPVALSLAIADDPYDDIPTLGYEDVMELLDLLTEQAHSFSCSCGVCRAVERLTRWTRTFP